MSLGATQKARREAWRCFDVCGFFTTFGNRIVDMAQNPCEACLGIGKEVHGISIAYV